MFFFARISRGIQPERGADTGNLAGVSPGPIGLSLWGLGLVFFFKWFKDNMALVFLDLSKCSLFALDHCGVIFHWKITDGAREEG